MLDSLTLYWGGAVTLISVLFAAFLKWYRFYTSTYVPRKLDLYDRLQSSAPEDSEVRRVISIAAEEEIFRIVFSQGGTPEYRKALIELYQSGEFRLRDLQLSKSCLDIDKSKNSKDEAARPIVGKFGVFDTVSLWVLSITLLFSLLFFGGLILSFMGQKTGPGFVAAGITFLLYLFTLFTVGSEVVRLFTSRRVCLRLAELKEIESKVLEPEKNA